MYENALKSMKTNYHKRDLLSGDQIPYSLFLDGGDFDYLSPTKDGFYEQRFFKYNGSWYDVNEFEVMRPGTFWHGVQTQSAWSGIFVHYLTEYGEWYVIVGYSYWG